MVGLSGMMIKALSITHMITKTIRAAIDKEGVEDREVVVTRVTNLKEVGSEAGEGVEVVSSNSNNRNRSNSNSNSNSSSSRAEMIVEVNAVVTTKVEAVQEAPEAGVGATITSMAVKSNIQVLTTTTITAVTTTTTSLKSSMKISTGNQLPSTQAIQILAHQGVTTPVAGVVTGTEMRAMEVEGILTEISRISNTTGEVGVKLSQIQTAGVVEVAELAVKEAEEITKDEEVAVKTTDREAITDLMIKEVAMEETTMEKKAKGLETIRILLTNCMSSE